MSFRRYYIWRAEDEVRINSLLAPLSALDHPQRQPCLLTHPCSLRCQCRCRCTAVINATTLAAGRPSAACATFATSDATTLAALAASHLHPHVYVVAINGPAQLMSASGAGRPSASRHLRPQVLGKPQYELQQGACFYTGVALALSGDAQSGTTPFVLSIERLDDRGEYTQKNTVFVAAEFNCTCGVQMSRELAVLLYGPLR